MKRQSNRPISTLVLPSPIWRVRSDEEDDVAEVSQIGIMGQTGTNWDTEMVSIWSLIPVSA